MRVLEVVPYYEPAWAFGGPPRVMSSEARELFRRGHLVTVFTTDAYERDQRLPSGRVVLDGVAVDRFRNMSNRAAFDRYRFQPRGMRRALRGVDADVVHLSEMRHELAVLTWQACRRRDLPLVVSAHGTLPRRGGWKGALRKQYDRVFVDPMVEGSAALVAQTEHEGDLYRLAGAPAERVHLVPLGLDGPPPADATAVPDLGVPDGARVIMFLGRIHPLKGVLRLIRGFVAAYREFDDVWLVIAGRDDGGQDEARSLATELRVSDRVSFPGPIYGDLRFAAYRRADLFAITPTHFEETSLASLEAASVGTPLLVSAQAEVPFLREYAGGSMIGSYEDLGPTLVELLLGTDLRGAGERARSMIEERHLWHRVGAQLESLFGEIS